VGVILSQIQNLFNDFDNIPESLLKLVPDQSQQYAKVFVVTLNYFWGQSNGHDSTFDFLH